MRPRIDREAARGRGELVIRRSTAGDRAALGRLAQLDSSRPPRGDHLLAHEDGELRAAVPLEGGPAIADPFHATAELVAMLELRAGAVRRPAGAAARGEGLGLRAGWRWRRPATIGAAAANGLR